LDKAPDAFRTISEVADELDIPQHVLRFWETRFAQIKPMKRSGGRRYYRPDDVDLLKGIRRLLYGEGYTIRGVQRILKEHGIKSVQGIADQTTAVSFGAVEDAVGLSMQEPEDGEAAGVDLDDEEGEGDIDYRFVDPDEDGILASFKGRPPAAQPSAARAARERAAPPAPTVAAPRVAAAERERLERVLHDLVAVRQLLDTAMKDG
jgi:DNA-binding transcriptional MerR regulator